MKKILCLLMGAALLLTVRIAGAEDVGKAAGMSTPVAGSTTVMKHKSAHKKSKSKTSKAKAAQEVWVCPMGDYSGPKTKDGKCPKCGMDLVKVDKKAGESDGKK